MSRNSRNSSLSFNEKSSNVISNNRSRRHKVSEWKKSKKVRMTHKNCLRCSKDLGLTLSMVKDAVTELGY